MTRGQLPKAYLRVDPNLDQTHPDHLEEFVRLLCVAARQPSRGRFRSRAVLEGLFSRAVVSRFYARGDVADQADGRVYVQGWDPWQEGDLTVAERMRRVRNSRNNDVTESSRPSDGAVSDASPGRNGPVTEPLPKRISPSEASRRQGVKAVDVLSDVTSPESFLSAVPRREAGK